MTNFGFYCKTYSGDFIRFAELVRTFHCFNKENIVMYVSVPEVEINQYYKFQCDTVNIISDESFAGTYMTDEFISGIRPGYINQEICKLTFYKTNLFNNYLCLDSDVIFIRDFYINDFMYDENNPYTVLIMDKDLSVGKTYRNLFWNSRQSYIKKIYDYIGINDKRLRTCHEMQVFNSEVLDSLYNDFMQPRRMKYTDLLEISPYEFTWYNVWFQKCKLIPEYAVEPFFKTLHIREHFIFSRLQNIDKSDFAYAYVGIVMNSKWDPPTPINYPPPPVLYPILSKYYFR